MATEVFSAAELARLRSWPSEIGSGELIRFFTLTGDDLEWLARSVRGETNRFGVAVQLCALPWLGFVPDDVAAAPAAAVARLASQLGVAVSTLEGYGGRPQTRTEQLRLVAARLGWRTANEAEWKDLGEFLMARAVEHDTPSLLFRLGCEFAASARIVRPGPVPLLRAVSAAREQAATEIYWRVEPLLGGQRRDELDGLLVVEAPLPVSRLAWLHRGATSSSPMAIRAELDKLRFLRELDAHRLDLSTLPAATRRRLAGIGRRSRNQPLANREETTRYPILLATVAECAVEVLDEVVGMFDQAVSGVENRARRKLDELLATRAKASETRLELLEDILAVTTDPDISDREVGARLRAGDGPVGWDRMSAARRDAHARLPRDHGHLEMIDASFTYLREFVPHVIAAVEFTTTPTTPNATATTSTASTSTATTSTAAASSSGSSGSSGAAAGSPGEVVAAVGVLRELYARGGRKVPDGAPDGFVPARWRGYLDAEVAAGNTTAYRHYWELCTLLALRDGLRSGDVWVPGSRRYADPATHLIDTSRWEALREEYAALVDAPLDVDAALGRARDALATGLGGLEQVLAAGEGPVRVAETGQLSLGRLAADTVPDVVAELRGQLVALLPRPQLTELLIEVDRWAGCGRRNSPTPAERFIAGRDCAASSTPRSWPRRATSG